MNKPRAIRKKDNDFNRNQLRSAVDRLNTCLAIKDDAVLVAFSASKGSMEDIIKEAAGKIRERVTALRDLYQKEFDEL